MTATAMGTEAQTSALRDYVAIGRRRWLPMVLVTVACALGAFLFDVRQPARYEAATLVQFDPPPSQLVTALGGATRPGLTPAQIRLANSDSVVTAVTNQFGAVIELSAAGDTDTATMVFTAASTSGARAAEAANAHATVFDEARRRDHQESLGRAIELTEQDVTALRETRAALQNSTEADAPAALEDNDLDLDTANGLLLVLQRAQRGGPGELSVLSPAVAPTSPLSPDPPRAAAIGLVAGFALAAAGAVALEKFDFRVRDRDQLEAVTPNLPLLAVIPHDRREVRRPTVSMHDDTPLAESFRMLRTAVQFVGLSRTLRAVQVTSADASEGKTTVTAHLAVALAQGGARVAVVDADMRHPSLHTRFGLTNDVGLSSVIQRQVTLADALQPAPECRNVFVLPAGPPPGNPADFLWSVGVSPAEATLPVIVEALTDHGFTVVIDCPPVLPVADALTVSRTVDATLLVVSADRADRRRVRRALEALEQVGAPLLGTVLNSVSRSRRDDYSYSVYPKAKRRGKGTAAVLAPSRNGSADVINLNHLGGQLEVPPAASGLPAETNGRLVHRKDTVE